jgi:hypothetical protein
METFREHKPTARVGQFAHSRKSLYIYTNRNLFLFSYTLFENVSRDFTAKFRCRNIYGRKLLMLFPFWPLKYGHLLLSCIFPTSVTQVHKRSWLTASALFRSLISNILSSACLLAVWHSRHLHRARPRCIWTLLYLTLAARAYQRWPGRPFGSDLKFNGASSSKMSTVQKILQ